MKKQNKIYSFVSLVPTDVAVSITNKFLDNEKIFIARK